MDLQSKQFFSHTGLSCCPPTKAATGNDILFVFAECLLSHFYVTVKESDLSVSKMEMILAF